MKVLDLINKIGNEETLPKKIKHRGNIGDLVESNSFINYLVTSKDNCYDMYWLIDHDLKYIDDDIEVLDKRFIYETKEN